MTKTKSFKKYIRNTFTRYAIAVLIVTSCFFTFTIYASFQFVVSDNDKINNEISRFIEDEFLSYENTALALNKDEVIIHALKDPSDTFAVNTMLYGISNNRKLKSNFVLVDTKSNIISSNFYMGDKKEFIQQQYKTIIKRFQQDDSIIINPINNEYNQQHNFIYTIGTRIEENNETIGYLLFFVHNLDNYIAETGPDIVVLTDRFDNILYTTNSIIKNSMGKVKTTGLEKGTQTINGTNYQISSQTIEYNNFKVYTFMSISSLFQIIYWSISLFLVCCIIIGIFIFVISNKFASSLSASLSKLIHRIEEIKKGELAPKQLQTDFTEFDSIHEEMNNMLQKISSLITYNKEMAEKKRTLEIKHLETQFNPHFVFNVLEMLKYEILFNSANAPDIILKLANLMRYNINAGNIECDIKTELDYLHDYLDLQKLRFGKRLQITMDIENEALTYKIPKLILQPIVENAIKHCIDKCQQLSIHLTCNVKDDCIDFKIQDDGVGIHMEKLMDIQATLENKENTFLASIGLFNAHRIIQLLYGINYGLSVESIENKGTCIEIKIPKEGENDA